jgi:hypothetical protein
VAGSGLAIPASVDVVSSRTCPIFGDRLSKVCQLCRLFCLWKVCAVSTNKPWPHKYRGVITVGINWWARITSRAGAPRYVVPATSVSRPSVCACVDVFCLFFVCIYIMCFLYACSYFVICILYVVFWLVIDIFFQLACIWVGVFVHWLRSNGWPS